jgi:hypothetical protein
MARRHLAIVNCSAQQLLHRQSRNQPQNPDIRFASGFRGSRVEQKQAP